MRIVLTCGPAYAPIDEVRRLTNFSTGELGTMLAEALAEAGHRVTCLRGAGSSYPAPLWPVEVVSFSTNDDLLERLERLEGRDATAFIFHAAALADFRVREITGEEGEPLREAKLSSRAGTIRLVLEPAPKVIARMRRLFPAGIIVGWKYELEGPAEAVRARGVRQMEENLTDACVLNGRGYGPGFGLISRTGDQAHLPDKAALCRHLVQWVETVPRTGPEGDPSFHALSSFIPLAPFI